MRARLVEKRNTKATGYKSWVTLSKFAVSAGAGSSGAGVATASVDGAAVAAASQKHEPSGHIALHAAHIVRLLDAVSGYRRGGWRRVDA